jgi:hypothetical protein
MQKKGNVIRIKSVSLTQKCESTKYVKRNKGKWDLRNKTRKIYDTKPNFNFDETKQNEISLFFVL